MGGTEPDRVHGRGGGSRLREAVILLVVAAGVGAGLKLASDWFEVHAVEPDEAPVAERSAYEDRWAAAVRDRPPAGQCAAKPGGTGGVLEMGTTPEGRPWMGAPAPALEIQEFTDYRCPDCRRAHMKVRRLLALFPDRVRVVYRHLPMDPSCNPDAAPPFHDRACELSRIAICAARQGRFWEAHDFLLQNADAVCGQRRCAMAVARNLDLDEDAFQCCMQDPGVGESVALDVAEARELGIRVTPTFRIGGKLYVKAIPEEALAALQERLP